MHVTLVHVYVEAYASEADAKAHKRPGTTCVACPVAGMMREPRGPSRSSACTRPVGRRAYPKFAIVGEGAIR